MSLPSVQWSASKCTPSAARATQTRTGPCSLPASTIHPSESTSGPTAIFLPDRTMPVGSVRNRVSGASSSRCPDCSCHASPAIRRPDRKSCNKAAARGSHASPKHDASCVAATSSAGWRGYPPDTSQIASTSVSPRPNPPRDSGTRMPSQPASAMAFHKARASASGTGLPYSTLFRPPPEDTPMRLPCEPGSAAGASRSKCSKMLRALSAKAWTWSTID